MTARVASFVVILLVGAAVTAAQARPQHADLASVANVGHGRVALSPAMRAELRHARVAPAARVLAVRGRSVFVRLGGVGNDHCYGVKNAASQTTFGFTCWDDFPSPAHPILDLSTFGADNDGPLHVVEAEGVAADGVATIALTDAGGAVVAEAPVSGNVYSLSTPPASAVRLVALDRKGRMLTAVPK
jgi:hypothetical protein